MLGCYLALALQPSLGGVVGIRLVAGAAEATFVVALYTSVMDMAPEERRGEAVSLVTLASYLGLTFGPVAADLIRGSDRYPLVWLVTAALGARRNRARGHASRDEAGDRGAVVAKLAPAARRAPSRAARHPRAARLRRLRRVRAIYARDLGIERPGLLFALFGGVVSIVRFFGRRLPDALGAVRTLELSFVCLAVGLALIGGWQLDDRPARRDGRVRRRPGDDVPVGGAAGGAVYEREPRGARSWAASGAAVDVALGLGALTLGAVAKSSGTAARSSSPRPSRSAGSRHCGRCALLGRIPPRRRRRDRRSTRTRRGDDAATRIPRRGHARRPADGPVDSAASPRDAGRDGRANGRAASRGAAGLRRDPAHARRGRPALHEQGRPSRASSRTSRSRARGRARSAT